MVLIWAGNTMSILELVSLEMLKCIWKTFIEVGNISSLFEMRNAIFLTFPRNFDFVQFIMASSHFFCERDLAVKIFKKCFLLWNDPQPFSIVEGDSFIRVIFWGITNGTFWDSILKCFTPYSQLKVTKKRNIWKKN